MKILELRRHAPRVPDTVYLSQAGVDLARHIGEAMGPFDRVITSPATWVHETAIAMGFAVDEHYLPVELTDAEWQHIGTIMPKHATFAERAAAMQADPVANRLAQLVWQQYRTYALSLPEESSLLIVTHGGYIDNGAAACLPDADHASWGQCFGHCEGIRLTFSASEFVEGQLLRVDE